MTTWLKNIIAYIMVMIGILGFAFITSGFQTLLLTGFLIIGVTGFFMFLNSYVTKDKD